MGARLVRGSLAMLMASLMAASPALAQSSATYTYDVLGRLVQVTYPSGGYVRYGYDAADNRVLLVMSLIANNIPVANNDGPVSVAPSGATTINVLANDTDADGDARTVSTKTNGAKGTVAIISSGAQVSYTPGAGQSGSDSFTYSIVDARGGTSLPATVSVNISAANTPPVANNDSPSTPYNTALANYNPRGNDTDADGDPITITGVSNFVNGTASSTSTTVSFTPTTNFSGTGSFRYNISDGRGGTSFATVSVNVGAAPNSPPVANNDSANTPVNTTLSNFNPRTNDSDPNGDPITITGVSNFVNGTASFTSTTVSFTPTTNFTGTGSFRYNISDGRGGTAFATVSVAVSAPANRAPVAVADARTTAYNTPITFDPRVNDSDPDGDPITVSQVSNFTNGTASFTPTSVTFTPTTNFSGTGSFLYTITDGRGLISYVFNTITVSPPAGVPNGTVLYTSSTPGAFSYTIPAGVAFVEIEIWGGGARGIAPFGNPIGGRGGGYVKRHIAVTTGQTIAGTIANSGLTLAAPSTVTSPALTTGDGTTTNPPSGGQVNTQGQLAGTPNPWTGGSSPNGGAAQNTQNANGNAPGGGGAGGAGLGAPGRVVIKARTS